jgi:hypothetical protein
VSGNRPPTTRDEECFLWSGGDLLRDQVEEENLWGLWSIHDGWLSFCAYGKKVMLMIFLQESRTHRKSKIQGLFLLPTCNEGTLFDVASCYSII